jgi:hypothetical protein
VSAATNESSPPAFVACFVLPRQQADALISLLQQYVSSAEELTPTNLSTLAIAPSEDSTAVWLSHPEAAKCLGISPTTLYRYAEHGRIECRKVVNRLEHRRSTLDRFKEQHIRPARRACR